MRNMKKNRRRQGKKTAVSEEDTPTPETETEPVVLHGPKVRRHKNGCIIIGDVKRFEIKRSVHSDDSNERFLNRTGAKISEAAAARRKKLRECIIRAFDGVPHGFCPLKGLKTDARLAGSMRKCASLAIADYNGQEHTDYRFIDIETAGWQIVKGTKYCITFRAWANGHYDTFEAEVVQRRFGRPGKRKFWVNIVLGVWMKKPGSSWLSGTLQELIN